MAEAESGASTGWSTPKRKQAELNDMYATLDIERDDSSDTDFIPDDADEAGDDDQVSDDSEESANLGHTGNQKEQDERKLFRCPARQPAIFTTSNTSKATIFSTRAVTL
ncbi:hypothetical protein PRIC2_008601 [Phytophthora ramorum]